MYLDWVLATYYGLFAMIGAWAAILGWRRYRLPAFAAEVYDSNVDKGLLNPKIDREAYIASYVRTEAPRSGAYRCASAFVSLLAVPMLISLFNMAWDTVWRWFGAVPGPYESGYMLHTFMTFVVVMAVIVGFLYLVTAYYYHTRPPTLAQEIKRLEGQS